MRTIRASSLVLAVIFHRQRFAQAFAFIIAGTRANRIDIAPVIFGLWMYQRIAIDLRGGCDKKACMLFACQFEHLIRSLAIDQDRLNGMFHIANGAGGTGEVKNSFCFAMKWLGDIVLQEGKAWIMQ